MSVEPANTDLGAFVPALLIESIAARAASPDGPTASVVTGAVLFVDISGFTPLTAQYAQRGDRGAEDLSELLNHYFGALTTEIQRHGGDVLAFAGDAVMGLWHTTTPSVASALATACGAAVISALDGFIPPGRQTTSPLRLRASVCSGRFRVAHVGGHAGAWMMVVDGAPLAELATLDPVSASGQVWLSRRTAEALADTVQVTEHPGGARLEHIVTPPRLPWLRERPVTTAIARAIVPYVPRVVGQRLATGQGTFLAEFRRVSVVFTEITSDLTDLEELHAVVAALQDTAGRLGGSLYQLLRDDKGTIAITVFGLPLSSHEDDAARACETALSLASRLTDLGHRCRSGVATGPVFCGPYGNTRRRQYGLVGDAMNRASRLMTTSDGVRCDAATRDAAHERLDAADLGLVGLKGLTQEVQVFCPTQVHARQRTFADGRLVGRERELAVLTAALDRLSDTDGAARGGVVLVRGEAGIGKSHLLHAARRAAAVRHLTTVTADADALERDSPWFTVRHGLADLLQLDKLGQAEASAAAVAALSDRADYTAWAPLLQDVLDLGLTDTPTTAQMTGHSRAVITRQLVAHIAAALGRERPTVWFIEDAHWLDAESWLTLPALARTAAHSLFVITSRPMDATPSAWNTLIRLAEPHVLDLTALDAPSSTALVAATLNVDHVDDHVSDFIFSRASGHPLFTTELARMLVERDAVRIAHQRARLHVTTDHLNHLDVPTTVQGVITSRIDALDPGTQLVVKVASAIGRVFPFEVLRAVHPVVESVTTLHKHIAAVLAADLALAETPEPAPSWAFTHALIQEVSYGLLVFDQRRALHRSIAEWYEAHAGSARGPMLALLAHHWEHAEVLDRAVACRDDAGTLALRAGANHEAATHFSRALALAPADASPADTARRARWHRGLGTALWELGQKAASMRAHTTCIGLTGEAFATTTAGRVLGMLATLPGHLRWLRNPTGQVVKDPDALVLWREATVAATELSQALYFNEDALGFFYGAFRAGRAGARAGMCDEQVDGMTFLGGALVMLKLRRVGETYLRRARLAAEHTSATHALHRHWQVCGTLYVGLAEFETVRQPLIDAHAYMVQIGDHHIKELIRTTQGLAFMYAGDFDQFITAFADVEASARARGALQHIAWCLYTPWIARLRRGETEGWLAILDEADDLHATEPEVAGSIHVLGLRALHAHANGDLTAARRYAHDTLDVIATTSPSNFSLSYVYAGLVHIFAAPFDITGAKRALRAFSRYAMMFPIAGPQYAICRARVAKAQGRHRRAKRLLDKAIATADRTGQRYDGALARLLRASLTPEGSPQNAALVSAARPVLESTGTWAWAEQIAQT